MAKNVYKSLIIERMKILNNELELLKAILDDGKHLSDSKPKKKEEK